LQPKGKPAIFEPLSDSSGTTMVEVEQVKPEPATSEVP